MTQSHSRSKRVLPRHIIATLAISGASVAGMAAPSFAEEPTQPSDGTTAATPNANGTAGAAVNEALAKAQLANLPQGNGDAPRDGDDKRTPGDDGGQAGDQNGGNNGGDQGGGNPGGNGGNNGGDQGGGGNRGNPGDQGGGNNGGNGGNNGGGNNQGGVQGGVG